MRRAIGGMALAVVLLLLSAGAGSLSVRRADAAGPLTGSTAEEALAAYFSAGSIGYAGDCALTVSPRDIGKVCATFIAQRQNVTAYLAGRTFSEYGFWLFVRYEQGGWSVVAVAPLDFFAEPLQVP